MADPLDIVLRDAIASNVPGLSATAPGRNVFRGQVRPAKEKADGTVIIPHLAVFILLTGGPTATHFIQGGEGPDMRRPTAQILVRVDVDDFEAGQDLSEDIWKVVQRFEEPDYISITVRESGPSVRPLDDTEHPRWSMNVDSMLRD